MQSAKSIWRTPLGPREGPFPVISSSRSLQRAGFLEKTGDFDMAVQVRSIINPNGWSRNGLMVRESLDDISKMLGAFATPPHGQGYFALDRREESAQCFWWNNDGIPGSAVKQGGIKYNTDTVPGLPDIWIRLKRSGNRFVAFRSANGQEWIEMGVNNLEFSDTVYFGICQSSPGTTRYANYGPFVYTCLLYTSDAADE
mgnify:CR=1 FL=1